MRRIADLLILMMLLTVAAYIGYFHRDEMFTALRQVEAKFAPCQSSITYSVGSIDPRFGISTTTFMSRLKEAEIIWEKPSGKDLFEYKALSGDVMVNLVYDNRQAASDTLKSAGIQIGKNKASYDALKEQYNSLSARVHARQVQHEQRIAAYKNHESQYNAEVESWNERGGAPSKVYERLQQEKVALQNEVRNISAEQVRLNADIETVNALATTLNQLIVQLNLNVQQYNQVGASQGEFEEGAYESRAGSQRIDIYEYSNRTELVRVLAHELGHALGLGHVPDPEAIMYQVNRSESLRLAADDIVALNAQCTSGIF